jgi:hypothetical protein
LAGGVVVGDLLLFAGVGEVAQSAWVTAAASGEIECQLYA